MHGDQDGIIYNIPEDGSQVMYSLNRGFYTVNRLTGLYCLIISYITVVYSI